MHDARHRTARPTNQVPWARSGQRGSAFIVALLVLLVLTVAGLALTLMTQTEVRIGANERTTNRTLYASESGIQVATARQLYIGPDLQAHTFMLNTTQQDAGNVTSTTPASTFSDQITITPLVPVGVQPCPGCQVNQNLSMQYSTINFVVNSTSVRTGASGAVKEAFSSKLLGSMIGLFPQPSQNAANPIQVQIPVQF
jgi:hypothetical protein